MPEPASRGWLDQNRWLDPGGAAWPGRVFSGSTCGAGMLSTYTGDSRGMGMEPGRFTGGATEDAGMTAISGRRLHGGPGAGIGSGLGAYRRGSAGAGGPHDVHQSHHPVPPDDLASRRYLLLKVPQADQGPGLIVDGNDGIDRHPADITQGAVLSPLRLRMRGQRLRIGAVRRSLRRSGLIGALHGGIGRVILVQRSSPSVHFPVFAVGPQSHERY